jgi:hypothetical protein
MVARRLTLPGSRERFVALAAAGLGNSRNLERRSGSVANRRGATFSIREIPSPFGAKRQEGGRCRSEVSALADPSCDGWGFIKEKAGSSQASCLFIWYFSALHSRRFRYEEQLGFLAIAMAGQERRHRHCLGARPL